MRRASKYDIIRVDMNTRFLGFLACLTGWAAVAHSAGLLQAQSFPKTFNDLSFTDRMALRAEGYAPFETEYDEQGRCISGCPYAGMTIEDEEEAVARLTDQAHRDLAAYRAQRVAAARAAMGAQVTDAQASDATQTPDTSNTSNVQSDAAVPSIPSLPNMPNLPTDTVHGDAGGLAPIDIGGAQNNTIRRDMPTLPNLPHVIGGAEQDTTQTLLPPTYVPQQPSVPDTEQQDTEQDDQEPEQTQPARPAPIERVTPVPNQPAQPLNPSGPARPVYPQPTQPVQPSEPEPEPEPAQPSQPAQPARPQPSAPAPSAPQPSAPAATRTCNPYVASTPVGNPLPTGCPLGANPMIITSPFTTSRYHPTKHVYKSHLGVDLRAAMGTDVFATAAGVVSYVGNEPKGCGTYVKILHDSNYATTYCHLSQALVSKGDKVEAGCRIGRSGNTGASSGPHLHYAITPNAAQGNKVAIDPTTMIEYCTLKNK